MSFLSEPSFYMRGQCKSHKKLWDLIAEKYQSRVGYKRILKALNVPWKTVITSTNKWRKCGTTEAMERSGQSFKHDERMMRKFKSPTAKLKELQESLQVLGTPRIWLPSPIFCTVKHGGGSIMLHCTLRKTMHQARGTCQDRWENEQLSIPIY